MANSTINFNPARFAGGVAKSFVSATTQVIASYMPFTSEVLSDASDQIFNVKEFINENRPDRRSRNDNNILKTLTNNAFNASKMIISDLSYGDLSFEDSRNMIGNYLSKHTKSEFDFGFDDDFGDGDNYDFEGDFDDNSAHLEEKGFTVEDFAEGIHASTTATVNAIETSYKNTALANAKSNNILGDRLIANNLATTAQTMQAFDVINKNVSGINANLANIVEYNNTTMNDFIQNTLTHFNKVEQFMDKMTQRFAKEEEQPKKKESTKIFEGTRINFGNLFSKATYLADEKFAGNSGAVPFAVRLLGSMMFGEKLPKWIEDLSTATDFGDILKYFNPMTTIVEKLFPELGQLRLIDATAKSFVGGIRSKIKGKLPDNKIGELLKELLEDEEEETYHRYKNKETPWSTSDSHVLQNIIPMSLGETNTTLFSIDMHASNIEKLLENNNFIGRSILDGMGEFFTDTLKYFGEQSKNANKQYYADRSNHTYNVFGSRIRRSRGQSRIYDRHKHEGIHGRYSEDEGMTIGGLNNYKKSHSLIFNSEEGKLESAQEIYDSSLRSQFNAYMTGSDTLAQEISSVFFADGALESLDVALEYYGIEQETFNSFQSVVSTYFEALMLEDVSADSIEIDDGATEIDIGKMVRDTIEANHIINATKVWHYFMEITSAFGLEFSPNQLKKQKIHFMNTIHDINESRKANIKTNEERHQQNQTAILAEKSVKGSAYKSWDYQSSERLIKNKTNIQTRSQFNIQTGDKFAEDLTKFGHLEDAARRYGVPISDIEEFLEQRSDAGDKTAETILNNMEKANREVKKETENVKKVGKTTAMLADNILNFTVGGILSPITELVVNIHDRFFDDDDGIATILTEELTTFASNFKQDVQERYEHRRDNAQPLYDEVGRAKVHWRESPNNFGYKQLIGINGEILDEVIDDDFVKLQEAAEQDGYDFDPDRHIFVKTDEDGNEKRYSKQYQFKQFATGATRIDKDQLVQVHEGEMILDKALSEDVRAQFANVLNNGGFDKMTDDQRKQLISAIEASNDAFKDRGEQTLNDILNETRKHDLNGTVDLSDESVCIIPINKDDSPASVIMKTLSEMATNTRIMLAGAIGSASVEDAENASGNVKSGFSKLFGSYDKEAKKLKGGVFTESANKFIDDMQYWAFKNIGGFSYTGTMRDEYGNKFEGDKQYFKNGEDNPETISKRFISMINERAEIAMDQMGVSADDKKRYMTSIGNLMGGVKGAGKGWVAGLAASGILGISIAPALGLLGGFAFANDTTKHLIFGKEATDTNGRKYRFGGVFSEFVNKFSDLGEDIRTNFKTTLGEIGKTMRDGATMFIDNLIHKDKPTIVGKLIGHLKDATLNVANTITDAVVDVATIGTKVIFKAAKLPFDVTTGLIGGKKYRKDKKDLKKAIDVLRVEKAYEDYIKRERDLGTWYGRFNATMSGLDLSVLGISGTHQLDKYLKFGENLSENKETKTETLLGKIHEAINNGLSDIKGQRTTLFNTGLSAIVKLVPASLMLASGNIPAAILYASLNLGNDIATQMGAGGLLKLISSGIRLIGAGAGNRFAKVKDSLRNWVHFRKETLGIKDSGFHVKNLARSSATRHANILGDLGISAEEQDAYYEWINNGRSAEGFTEEQLARFKDIDFQARMGISDDALASEKKLKADEDRYNALKQRKADAERYYSLVNTMDDKSDWTDDDKEFFRKHFKNDGAELELSDEDEQFMSDYKKQRVSRNATKFGNWFDRRKYLWSHGSMDEIDQILATNAKDNAKNKALRGFRSSASGVLTTDMLPGLTDEERAEEQKYYDKVRRGARGDIFKKFGNSTEAMNEHFEEIVDILANSPKYKDLMKDANSFKNGDELYRYLTLNSNAERALDEAKAKEEQFKDKIIGENDSIFSYVKQTKEDLKNMLELFKTWINTEKKEEPIDDKISDLGEGSSRSKVAEMYGFDVNKLKNGDEAEKARFAKAQADGDLPVDIINAVTQAVAGHDEVTEEDYNQYASGATNIPHDQVAKLHAGEAVLDAETAKSFRSGAFGGGGILADTMASIKNGIGDLVSVFKGDEHGNADAKKSFLDKMKEGFSRVGQTITGAVFGSGLIPLDPLTGQPDIAKIGARLIALLGGVLVLGPIIGKVAQALKPIFEPLLEGIKTAVTSAVSTVKDVIYDMAGVDSFDGLMKKTGAYIYEGWKHAGEYSYESTAGSADEQYQNDKTVQYMAENKKSITENLKSSGSNIQYSEYSNFCNACSNYFYAIFNLGKGMARVKASAGNYGANTFVAAGTSLGGVESQLTIQERQYLSSAIVDNRAFFSGYIMGDTKIFKMSNAMGEFCKVIYAETGINVKYDNNVYSFDTNVDASKVVKATDTINRRILVLNTLSNFDGKYNLNYIRDQYVSQNSIDTVDLSNGNVGQREEKPAGNGIGYGYTQNDPRWSSMGYGRFKSGRASTMGSGGCGPTAMSNVYTQLTGRTINPAQMARFSQANGYNAQGGTSAGLFTSGARKLGLSSRAIGKNGSAIGRSVMNGNGVIIAGKNGPYTRAGHIMSVRGVDGFGNAIVDDPLRRGARRIPMNKLTKGMTHAWSIGHGQGIATSDDGNYKQNYSMWYDMFGDTIEPTFNLNGGAYAYTPNLDSGCLYNSIVSGFVNSILAGDEGDIGKVANKFMPYALLKRDGIAGVRSSDQLVESSSDLLYALNKRAGTSVQMTDSVGANALQSILSTLDRGYPVVLHSKKIQNAGNEALINIFGNHSQHAVLLAGTVTGKEDGMKYIVIDNPDTQYADKQVKRISRDEFSNTISAKYSELNHAYLFNPSGSKYSSDEEKQFNRLKAQATHGSDANGDRARAYDEFTTIFGFPPDKYETYDDYIRDTTSSDKHNIHTTPGGPSTYNSTGSSNSGTTSIGNWQIPADLLEHRSHTNFVEYIADIAGRLAQLGSNILGSLISGDTSGLTKGPSGGVGFASGIQGGGGSGTSASGGGSGYLSNPEIIVNKTHTQVMLYVTEAYNTKSDEINKELGKEFPKYTVTDKLYNDWKSNATKSVNISRELANHEDYWKYVSMSYPALYTWVLAMMISDYPENISADVRNNRITADIKHVYNKITKVAFVGYPHNDYYLIPQWAKSNTPDNRPSSEIPGGVGGGATLSSSQIASVHQYLMDIITKNETGADIHDPSQIDKAYFNPIWLSGEGNVTMGRIGFYSDNAKKIFERAAGNPALSSEAKNILLGVSSSIANRSANADSIRSVLNAHPELKPSIMSAEDAMTNEFVWDYVSRALGQYQQLGLQDPRSIILGAEFAGVAPARVPGFYSAITNPGAADELNQVRQGMFNTIASFPNYGRYGKGWKNRINGMYDALTSSNGYNPHTGKYYPMPSDVAALIPGNSVGYGDAGYAMRDNNYRYTDDIYMGDADHPMNVTMDNTPVTTRLDKLIYLLDSAVNYNETPKSGPSNAKPLGNGNGDMVAKKQQSTRSSKGETSVGAHDRLATIHNKIAKRTRVGLNYNQL